MPDETNKTSKAVGKKDEPVPNVPVEDDAKKPVDEVLAKVIEKIDDADSILVVLSKDPSVDEIAAAIALTLSLDRIGKHTTAIYSGKTPNALQFLEPEKTFETNTNSLQDFIIALDKEKADHLRYKIEGDFVKVYMTPYKTTISEKDLEFYHGEVNVDMVISLNVPTPEDLDAALEQHGRIMHDAVTINISDGAPGRIGGLEWNDATASSISEMILRYLDASSQNIEKDVATALLTGIVAETNRFSNERTTPDTMAASSELMQKGADQQLIVSHMDDMEAEMKKQEELEPEKAKHSEPSSIDVSDDETADAHGPEISENSGDIIKPETGESSNDFKPETNETKGADDTISPEAQLDQMIASSKNDDIISGPLMDELKAAANENGGELKIDKSDAPEIKPEDEAVNGKEVAEVKTKNIPVDRIYNTPADMVNMDNGVMAPMEELEQPKDYGAMMEEALAEPINNSAVMNNPAVTAAPAAPMMPEMQPATGIQPAPVSSMGEPTAAPMAPVTPTMPEVAPTIPAQPMPVVPEATPTVAPSMSEMMSTVPSTPVMPSAPTIPETTPMMQGNPATSAAPVAPTVPEAQPIAPVAPVSPEIPAPPAPPVSFGAMPPESIPSMTAQSATMQPVVAQTAAPQPMATQPMVPQDNSDAMGIPEAPTGVTPPPEPVNPVVVQPVQDPTSVPPVQDPGSFKIPGM